MKTEIKVKLRHCGSCLAGIMLLVAYLLAMRLQLAWAFGTTICACFVGYLCAETDMADFGDSPEDE